MESAKIGITPNSVQTAEAEERIEHRERAKLYRWSDLDAESHDPKTSLLVESGNAKESTGVLVVKNKAEIARIMACAWNPDAYVVLSGENGQIKVIRGNKIRLFQ